MPIRPAQESDLLHLIRLLREAALPIEGVADHLNDFLVACDVTGKVVGGVGLETYGTVGLLRSVVVDPAHRGQGVAATLCRELLAAARDKGLTDVFLLTTDAADYFTRHGFKPCERSAAPPGIQATEEYCHLCPETAVFMRLILSPVGK